MAAQSRDFLFGLTVVLVALINYSFAVNFECEELRVEDCAFAVSSSGARCVLETNVMKEGSIELECQTSEIITDKFNSWIESAECINSCGLNRMLIGLSSDFLGEHDFHKTICAAACQENCPNIVELYTKLADGEEVGLEALCEVERTRSRKLVQSSQLWDVAANPRAAALAPLPY